MKTGRLNRILNYVLAMTLLVLWVSVFVIHGLAGAVAWSAAVLFIAPAGVILVLINLTVLIVSLVRKTKAAPQAVALILSVFLAAPVLILLNIFPVAYPAQIDQIKPSITVKWPLRERTLVAWGGNTLADNRPHAVWPSERWAYDLVMDPADTGSKDCSDYGIYDKEVVAPVSGTIVAAYDKEDDIEPNTDQFLSMEGNHVYIKIDQTGTYLLLNHLKKGSVLVQNGDRVNEGDIIARVGNSGSTSEPHLHIQHQRQDPTKTIYPIFAEGLPLYFKDIDGESMPLRGSIITPEN